MAWLLTFSRAFGSVRRFYFEFSLVLEGIFIASEMKIPLRGHCGYFGFGFTIQSKKRSNREKSLISEVFSKVQTVGFARHSGKFLCTNPTVTENQMRFSGKPLCYARKSN